ncbi:hypothetical protein FDO65_07290 [Nakamurella flava]|uniref:DoxX family protein n=1 Tax=Nakamurella flava TaxID=2576308 RepID=A0A4U6QLH3_9ACTN|nr:hypothetical protein [Nakamurella flava]TKV61384.1 hypothetical protein FDO65_07290 [Nakamurella flava]
MTGTPHRLPAALAALLGGAGVLHFVAPRPFIGIVPRSLPRPEALVALSGAAEIGCAALLAVPQTRRVGGWASAALFVGVYPANVSMALRSTARGSRRPVWYRVVAWARLPLQAPLVLAAVRVARRA